MAKDIGGEIFIEDAALAGGFVQVPIGIFFDSNLKDGPVRTYGALLWYAWKQGRAPGQEVMAQELGMGLRTIQRHLKDLQTAGYIAVEQLGLGKANRYVIKTLSPDLPKLAGLTRQFWRVQAAKNGRSLKDVKDVEVKDNTLSHRGNGLVEAFFSAIGESKPSKKRRERAILTINDLTTQGFSEEVLQEAIRLAAERGARGPDLLPHVVGEAHSRIEAREVETTRRAQHMVAHEEERERLEAEFKDELAAVEMLPQDEREELEAQCRTSLPPTISEQMLANVLPGMIAARLRQGQGM